MVIDRRGDQPTGGRSSIKTLTVNWPTTSAWTIWSSGRETARSSPEIGLPRATRRDRRATVRNTIRRRQRPRLAHRCPARRINWSG